MGFLDFRLLDIIDILVAAWLLYQIYRLIRGTVAINIFLGVLAIYLFWKLTQILEMTLLSEMLGQFIGVGFIALIVVFQQEIRRFLLMIGSANFGRRRRFLSQLKWLRKDEKPQIDIDALIDAALELSEDKLGALIVIKRKTALGQYAQTGDRIDARLSSRLLISLFLKDSPMHDGAVIVEENRIVAARAILPVSDNLRIPANYGMRHRAAAGLTEKTDALCLLVSEETGGLALVSQGRINIVKKDDLRAELSAQLEIF